jgi:hypothetical protein
MLKNLEKNINLYLHILCVDVKLWKPDIFLGLYKK